MTRGIRHRRGQYVRPRCSLRADLAGALVAGRHRAASRSRAVARGSVGQAYVLGAPAARRSRCSTPGKTVRKGEADRLGSRIFRGLRARGYRVTAAGAEKRFASSAAASNPSPPSSAASTQRRASTT